MHQRGTWINNGEQYPTSLDTYRWIQMTASEGSRILRDEVTVTNHTTKISNVLHVPPEIYRLNDKISERNVSTVKINYPCLFNNRN
jgi:hypothetical protein